VKRAGIEHLCLGPQQDILIFTSHFFSLSCYFLIFTLKKGKTKFAHNKMERPICVRLVVLALVVVLATSAVADPVELVPCPSTNASTCFTFGFTFPGAGSLLAVEGLAMKSGYILWAETVNNATDGIATK
jgi:hypothetical protein